MSFKHRLSEAVNHLLAPFDGALVRRSQTAGARRVAFCSRAQINLVLDIGAATGEYAEQLRSFGYDGQIISFEPLPDSFEALRSASQTDPLWSARNLALGDARGRSTLHVAKNRDSSSLAQMLDRHIEGAPRASIERSIDVEVERLDDQASIFSGSDRCLMKVDVQGFEAQVLSGAAGILDKIQLMELELSLVHLYDQALLYQEMIDHVAEMDFEPIWFEPGFMDQRTGRLLQMDGIFARTTADWI